MSAPYRFAIVQIFGLSLLGLAIAQGWLQGALAVDVTYFGHAILLVSLAGLLASWWAMRGSVRAFRLLERAVYLTPVLGFVGTALGFALALMSYALTAGSGSDPLTALAPVLSDMAAAMMNMVVAVLGHAWLWHNLHFIAAETGDEG